jgi:hypothetical protein
MDSGLFFAFGIAFIIIPFVLGLVVIWHLFHKQHDRINWHLYLEYGGFYTILMLMAASNLEILLLLPWDMNQPKAKRRIKSYRGYASSRFVLATMLTTLFEDVPQLFIQLGFVATHGSTAIASISILTSVLNIVFKVLFKMTTAAFGKRIRSASVAITSKIRSASVAMTHKGERAASVASANGRVEGGRSGGRGEGGWVQGNVKDAAEDRSGESEDVGASNAAGGGGATEGVVVDDRSSEFVSVNPMLPDRDTMQFKDRKTAEPEKLHKMVKNFSSVAEI